MATIKLTQNEQVNGRAVRFVADLLCKMVSSEVSVPQAVAMVNKFADSLRGSIPDDQWADAHAYMMDYVFSAKNTMVRNHAEGAKNSHPSDDPSTDALLLKMRKALLDGDLTLAQAMGFADKLADAAKNAGLPEDQWYRYKAHLSEFLLMCQVEKEQQQHDANPRITLLNEEDIPWQEREPWRTIKTHLPPAMIDTEEKERKVAWRIGFLLGYGAEKAAAAAIREYGLVGGAGLVALFAWAYQQIRRN